MILKPFWNALLKPIHVRFFAGFTKTFEEPRYPSTSIKQFLKGFHRTFFKPLKKNLFWTFEKPLKGFKKVLIKPF